MYPNGRAQLNVIVPPPVKEAIDRVAFREHRSTSQMVTLILQSWLAGRGEIRDREEAAV
jgi:hypothetical protein